MPKRCARSVVADQEHVLVTGGAGFIGSHLVERLLRDGKTVVVIDDCSTGGLDNLEAVANHPQLRFVARPKYRPARTWTALVADSTAIYHLAAAVGVELVVHSPIRTIETNLHETEVLLEAAGAHHTPVLLASTSEVYGKSQKPAFDEEDDLLIGPPHLGRWSYACSKLMDEFLALAYANEKSLPVIIVRLFNTVGPRQTGRYGMVLPRFIAAAQSGRSSAGLWRRQPNALFLLRRRHGGSARAADGSTGRARAGVQCREHGRGFHPRNSPNVSSRALHSSVRTSSLPPYDQAYATGFQDMLRRKPIIERNWLIHVQPAFRPHATLTLASRSIETATARARSPSQINAKKRHPCGCLFCDLI